MSGIRPRILWLGLLMSAVCLLTSSAHAVELTNLELVFQKSRRCLGFPSDTLMFWGRSISTAGDVNADGYDDIIVAAAWYEAAGPDPWLSMGFIFFGGDPMDTIPDVILTGDHDGEARVEVSCAGDVNADGFSDVVISNHGDEGVRIFFGGDPMDTLYDVLLQDELSSRSYANSIDHAGDVNGDGYDDIVLGDYMDDWLNGSVFVYFGGPGLDGYPDVVLKGHRREGFGMQVAGGGDVNGDGCDDIVVGEWVNSDSLLDAGKIYVFFGGDPMDTIPDVWMYGEEIGHRLGYLRLDITKVDGMCDWVVAGNRFYPDGFPSTCSGKVYVLFGDTLMDGVPDAFMLGRTDSSGLGRCTKSAGRVAGSGLCDVLSCAVTEYEDRGSTYLWFSGVPFDTIPDGIATGSYSSEMPAWLVASAGDADGDGRDEIMFSNYASWDTVNTVWICRYTGTGVLERTMIQATDRSTILMQNQPNPFYGSTVIRFRLHPEDRRTASLDVFDASGRCTRKLWRCNSIGRSHSESMFAVAWDGKDEEGRDVPPGVYFCRLCADGFEQAGKMVLLR